MEKIRMPYRDYKRHYPMCDTVRESYDSVSKSIVVLVPDDMVQPKRGTLRFDPKRWENRGQEKLLRGYRISVRQYNQGKDASFYLEAWGNPYDRLRGATVAPYIGKYIPGYGPTARDIAITEAFKFAETGIYTETDQ